MKKHTIKFLAVSLSAVITLGSCGKDYLELEPRGTQLEDNYYKNQTELFNGLISVYDVIQWGTSGGYTMKQPLLTVASDEAHAGGSNASDQPSWVAYNDFTLDPFRGPQVGLWQKNFTGVYRANLFLQKIGGPTITDPSFKSRTIAEVKFLRAYFYFDLVRWFGRVPLILDAIPTADLYKVPQSETAAIYAQIEKDLTEAIPDLPLTIAVGENGRISKGAAEATLGKVIMFQNDNSRMAEAASWFNKVNTSGVYDLLSNFGDVFNPANRFSAESILEIPHSNNAAWGDWGWVNGGEGNVGPQFIGMADYGGPTFSAGWGFAPVSLDLVSFMTGDPRFQSTIIDGNALKAGGANYTERYQNTNYFIRKYAPMQAYRSAVGTAELNWPYNEIEIRLADTYLYEAEAILRSGGDASRAGLLLNTEVRGRVGLGAVAVTLENVYRERRMELATEGHRFFDLIRTNQAATVLGPLGFVAGKSEVLPIPQREIDVTNGVLEQNPNY